MRILKDVVRIPVACETNRYVACFTSMLVYMERIHESTVAAPCKKKKQPLCTGCGECGSKIENTLGGKHESLYNHYLTVSGDDQKVFAVDETMAYAGYEYVTVERGLGEQALRERIVAAIDRGQPVPIRIAGSTENWCLVTGYDEDGAVLIGWDGYGSYWADGRDGLLPAKDGYLENGMFHLRAWYPSTALAVIVTGKGAPRNDDAQVFRRLIAAIEAKEPVFAGIVARLRQADEASLTAEGLQALFDSWAGLLYDQVDSRFMASCSFRTTFRAVAPDGQKPAMNEIANCFLRIHDLVWEVFAALGDRYDAFFHPGKYVEELRKPDVRQRIADLVEKIAGENDQAVQLLRGLV